MFENNNKYINEYNQLLKQLTYMGANFKSDDDKIKVISTINYLKYIANKIEPRASIDWYERNYK
jgi:hypothetical protein